jgi:hypothetical protein
MEHKALLSKRGPAYPEQQIFVQIFVLQPACGQNYTAMPVPLRLGIDQLVCIVQARPKRCLLS